MDTTANVGEKRIDIEHSIGSGASLSAQVRVLSVARREGSQGALHTSVPHDLFTLTVCAPHGWDSAGHAKVTTLRSHSVVIKEAANGPVRMLWAQLTPLGWLRGFGTPWQGLTDAVVEIRNLNSSASEAALHRALVDAQNDEQRCDALGAWLEARLTERRPIGVQAERVAAVAMCMLEGEPEEMEPLARRHGVSRRQLERDFRHWLGVSPRTYSRLVRFQRSARALADGVAPAAVAADNAYADQAHMTRAFRETAGITPGQMRAAARYTEARDGGALRRALGGRLVMLPHHAATPQRALYQ